MSTNPKQHAIIVVLGLPKHPNAKEIVALERQVSAGLKANAATFPHPPVALAQLDGEADALEAKMAAAAPHMHPAEAIPQRKAAQDLVESHLHTTQAYVQTTIDALPYDSREAAVKLAGMQVRKVGEHHVHDMLLENAATSGGVNAHVKSAGHRAGYRWGVSTDGGKTYGGDVFTLQAHYEFTGLPVGTTAWIHCAPVTKTGQQDWMTPMSIVVK